MRNLTQTKPTRLTTTFSSMQMPQALVDPQFLKFSYYLSSLTNRVLIVYLRKKTKIEAVT
jgi:hypothetical protein